MITGSELKKKLNLTRKEYLNLFYRYKIKNESKLGEKIKKIELADRQFITPIGGLKGKGGKEYEFDDSAILIAYTVHLFRTMGASYEEIENKFYINGSGNHVNLNFFDEIIQKNKEELIKIQQKLDTAIVLKQVCEWVVNNGLIDEMGQNSSKTIIDLNLIANDVKYLGDFDYEYVLFLKEYGVERFLNAIFKNGELLTFLNETLDNNEKVSSDAFEFLNKCRRIFSEFKNMLGRPDYHIVDGLVDEFLILINEISRFKDDNISKEILLVGIYYWDEIFVEKKLKEDFKPLNKWFELFFSDFPLKEIRDMLCKYVEIEYPEVVYE